VADIIDKGCEREQMDNASAVDAARRQAAKIPAGNAGTCYSCGEESQRLVKGACASCRDKYGLE
jgi:hypothetical protein